MTQEEEKAFWALQLALKSAPKAGKEEALNLDIMGCPSEAAEKIQNDHGGLSTLGTICAVDGITAEDIGVIDIRESLTLCAKSSTGRAFAEPGTAADERAHQGKR